jgi:hypothetical protein
MMWRNEAFRFFREFDYSEVAMRCVRIFPTPDRETRHREVRHFGRWFYVGGGYAWKRFTSSQPKEEQRLILITLPERLDSLPKFQLWELPSSSSDERSDVANCLSAVKGELSGERRLLSSKRTLCSASHLQQNPKPRVLPPPVPLTAISIAMRRGFIASGSSRARSIFSMPFSKVASFTWTKSARLKTRRNGRKECHPRTNYIFQSPARLVCRSTFGAAQPLSASATSEPTS